MKRIEFIAPVESMRGNLSGGQSLEYADNNNPAYEAPNGVQYARNYQPRFIGAKRGADGLKYFSVRTKSATNLKATTRRTMAILGVTAAIRSALQASGQLNNLKAEFEILKQAGTLPEGQNTFNKWFSANIKTMLVYKRAEWRFTLPGVGIVSIHNPFDLNSAEALAIKQSIWVKFATFFLIPATAGNVVLMLAIDGKSIVAQGAKDFTWNTLISGISTQINVNYKQNLAGLSLSDDPVAKTLYNDLPIYLNEIEVSASDAVTASDKYTTAEPIVP